MLACCSENACRHEELRCYNTVKAEGALTEFCGNRDEVDHVDLAPLALHESQLVHTQCTRRRTIDGFADHLRSTLGDEAVDTWWEESTYSEVRVDSCDDANLGLDLVHGVGSGDESLAVVAHVHEKGALHGKVNMFDRIVEVNGIRGSFLEILQAINLAKALNMTVRKPRKFRAIVAKGGQRIGMELIAGCKGAFFLIKHIDASGAIATANAQYSDREIRQGDYILEVNGATDCEAMLKEMSVGDILDMRLIRHLNRSESSWYPESLINSNIWEMI